MGRRIGVLIYRAFDAFWQIGLRRRFNTCNKNVMNAVKHFRDLDVYQGAMSLVMRIFELTKHFPIEERYTLTDQVRRSSRSVCANLAEAWRKRRYQAAFVQSSMTRRLRQPRPKFMSRLLFGTAILSKRSSTNSMTPATRSWLRSLK